MTSIQPQIKYSSRYLFPSETVKKSRHCDRIWAVPCWTPVRTVLQSLSRFFVARFAWCSILITYLIDFDCRLYCNLIMSIIYLWNWTIAIGFGYLWLAKTFNVCLICHRKSPKTAVSQRGNKKQRAQEVYFTTTWTKCHQKEHAKTTFHYILLYDSILLYYRYMRQSLPQWQIEEG